MPTEADVSLVNEPTLTLAPPNPFAVPLLVIVAPLSTVNVEPLNILKALALNLKSSAPAIFISI